MGLMHLLTVGRSLSEVRDEPHRYKLRNGQMPTFGHPPAQAVTSFAVPGLRQAGSEVGQRRTETTAMKTETSAEQEVATAAPQPLFPQGRWTSRVNPFRSTARPVRPAAAAAVQGELSLEKVKPVRNDLSDSDLELVRAAKQAEPAPAAVKIEGVAVPVVRAQPFWARVRGWFTRQR